MNGNVIRYSKVVNQEKSTNRLHHYISQCSELGEKSAANSLNVMAVVTGKLL